MFVITFAALLHVLIEKKTQRPKVLRSRSMTKEAETGLVRLVLETTQPMVVPLSSR